MAQFIETRSPTGNQTYFVNPDEVRYVTAAPSKTDQCILHFGGGSKLTIAMSAQSFTSRAGLPR
jgi:hypothetical protein